MLCSSKYYVLVSSLTDVSSMMGYLVVKPFLLFVLFYLYSLSPNSLLFITLFVFTPVTFSFFMLLEEPCCDLYVT